jgi:hypothetical protein
MQETNGAHCSFVVVESGEQSCSDAQKEVSTRTL